MGIEIVTPPVSDPVSISEAKEYLRVTSSDEDARITALISAAVGHIRLQTGMSLSPQTLRLSLDQFNDAMRLPYGPVTSVTSVVYDDPDGAQQTLSTDVYQADLTSDRQWVVRKSDQSWPEILSAINSVRITYDAGYVSTPEPIKQAILLLVGEWFEYRAPVSMRLYETPHAVRALIADYRTFVL